MKIKYPTPEQLETQHKQKMQDIKNETALNFKEAVKLALFRSNIYPIFVEEAAYLTLDNPVLKEVESDLNASGYDTFIMRDGSLRIERKK